MKVYINTKEVFPQQLLFADCLGKTVLQRILEPILSLRPTEIFLISNTPIADSQLDFNNPFVCKITSITEEPEKSKDYIILKGASTVLDKINKLSDLPQKYEEGIQINSSTDYEKLIKALNKNTTNALKDKGVIFEKAKTCQIAPEVKISAGTIIGPNCKITGNTIIGENNSIEMNTVIENATIGDNNNIRSAHIYDSKIGNNCRIGPYVQLRNNVIIDDNCLIGNFVEIKNTIIQSNTNASHLSYLGDAELGSNVNIGAGTITANYNAITEEKTKTILSDGVKTGSNSVFVAPVNIAKDSMIAAGSVITKSIEEEGSLGISRTKQSVINNWVNKQKKSS